MATSPIVTIETKILRRGFLSFHFPFIISNITFSFQNIAIISFQKFPFLKYGNQKLELEIPLILTQDKNKFLNEAWFLHNLHI